MNLKKICFIALAVFATPGATAGVETSSQDQSQAVARYRWVEGEAQAAAHPPHQNLLPEPQAASPEEAAEGEDLYVRITAIWTMAGGRARALIGTPQFTPFMKAMAIRGLNYHLINHADAPWITSQVQEALEVVRAAEPV